MIGTRGHDISDKGSAEELASRLELQEFESVQLVAYKSIKGVSEKAGYLTPGAAHKIGQAFKKHNIHIGLIGSYFNLLDEDVVEEGIARFKEYLKYGKELGGYLVGTETGSFMKNWTYHPDNHSEEAYQKVFKIFSELVGVAQNHGMCVGIEGAYHHSIGTPKQMKRLIDELDSTNVLAILDPYNFLCMENYENRNAIIQEAFELYGDKIAVFHAKDFVVKGDKLLQVPIGDGLMDYQFIKQMINEYRPGLDIIIEGQTDAGLKKSQKFLTNLLA